MPAATEYRWQCPECKKLQKSSPATADGAFAHDFFTRYADPQYDIWKGGGSKASRHAP